MDMLRMKIICSAKKGIFFDSFYKRYLKAFFKKYCDDDLFVFSDVFPKKTRKTDSGFWAIDKIAFYFSHPDVETLIGLSLKLLRGKIVINDNQELGIERIDFVKTKCSKSGYLWSPLVVVDKNFKPVEYEKKPEEFSELLRANLIDKYERIFHRYPDDDRFVFLFKNNFEKKIEGDLVAYIGAFEIVGSKMLAEVAYLCGLGFFNEDGYGMISDELYVWKR